MLEKLNNGIINIAKRSSPDQLFWASLLLNFISLIGWIYYIMGALNLHVSLLCIITYLAYFFIVLQYQKNKIVNKKNQ